MSSQIFDGAALVALIESAVERAVAKALADLPKPAAPASEREWMTTEDAAAYVGLRPITLEIKRCKGGGPKYEKPARNIVRYRRSELDAWLAGKARRNTSQRDPS